ncbi:SCO1664 family protein [Streptomyces aidingensis]|uniref:SCO1664 family protein n=1 Tax=Streptomyces aidingensis TaxID=910347 RepID=A0A1I1S0E5_9ACTN|nr:SCO1664 family protein [Streptomyces aidingensis]SFD39995.1 conserved hypothetical protein [Streptomyces aidingensis]
MPASERIPQGSMTVPEVLDVLAHGRLGLAGRLTSASNAVFYGHAEAGGERLPCVWKPVAGERPLWDFPEGTLAGREVAAFEICRALGWDFVPPTVLREGPHGPGMCQQWVGPLPDRAEEAGTGAADRDGGGAALLRLVDGDEPGPGWRAVGHARLDGGRTALLVHADDQRLRRLAAFDAVINNGDRKGGHLIPLPDGRMHAIDHGVSLHTEDKLRTLLWGWAGEPLPGDVAAALRGLAGRLAEGSPLSLRLAELITKPELAALRARTEALLAAGRHPEPGGDWPAIPWPPV